MKLTKEILPIKSFSRLLPVSSSKRTLLLKWAVLNAVSAVFLAAMGVSFGSQLKGAPLVGVGAILVVFAIGSGFGGRLCVEAEDPRIFANEVLHRASWLTFWAWICQMAGILATLAGLEILLSKGAGNLHDRLLHGGGIVFMSTFVGVFASIVITAIHRLIEHELEA